MEQFAKSSLTTRYDRVFRLIQKRLADKIQLPIEIQLWGDHVYRLGKGEPVIRILVKDRQGLSALSELRNQGVRLAQSQSQHNQGVTIKGSGSLM